MAFSARFSPASTGSDFILPIRLRATDTGDLIDLTGCVVTIKFYDERSGQRSWPCITAGTSTGEITIPETGIILLTYLAANATAFSGLRSGLYTLVLTVSRDGLTREILCGSLPVRGAR